MKTYAGSDNNKRLMPPNLAAYLSSCTISVASDNKDYVIFLGKKTKSRLTKIKRLPFVKIIVLLFEGYQINLTRLRNFGGLTDVVAVVVLLERFESHSLPVTCAVNGNVPAAVGLT